MSPVSQEDVEVALMPPSVVSLVLPPNSFPGIYALTMLKCSQFTLRHPCTVFHLISSPHVSIDSVSLKRHDQTLIPGACKWLLIWKETALHAKLRISDDGILNFGWTLHPRGI